MNDLESSAFMIGRNKENPDAELQNEIAEQKLEKLNQRVTLISILIPCMIGVILFIVYLNIKKKVSLVHDSGTTEIQNLSKDVEARLSALRLQYKDFKYSINNQVLPIEKAVTSLQDNLKKTEKNIQSFQASKVDKNELKKNLSPVQKDLKNLVSEIKVLKNMTDSELAKLTENINTITKSLQSLQTDLTTLSLSTIDRETLALSLEELQKLEDQKLNQTVRDLGERIDSIRKKIFGFEKNSPPASIQQPPSKPANPPVTKPKPSPAIKPEDDTAIPKPGQIIEQDINE